MIISAVYLIVCCLLSCLTALTRHQVSKDAEPLHENALLRHQIGRVRYEPGDRPHPPAPSRGQPTSTAVGSPNWTPTRSGSRLGPKISVRPAP